MVERLRTADQREQEAANVNMILRQLGVTPREEDMDSQEIEEEY